MITVINLNPVRSDSAQEMFLDIDGLTVFVNGAEFNFGPMGIGDELPSEAIDSEWFSSPVKRTKDGLEFTINFKLGENAPEEARFPKPIVVTENGPVTLPAYKGETETIKVIPDVPSIVSEVVNEQN